MSMLLTLFSLILAWTNGWLLLALLQGSAAKQARPLRMVLAGGLGLGLSSLLFYLHLCLLGSAQRLSMVLELACLGLLGLAMFWRRRFRSEASPVPPSTLAQAPAPKLLIVLLALLLVAGSLAFILQYLEAPHGRGDALWIWNYRARFLFFADQHWPMAFVQQAAPAHADYPILLPLLIVRSWGLCGTANTLLPALFAYLFTLGTAALLYAGLLILRGKTVALLAAITALGTASFWHVGALQYADMPLAFYFLAALMLCCLADQEDAVPSCRSRYLLLAGFMAGLAAWTKNEGLLFLLVLPLTRLLAPRGLGFLLLGMLPCLLALWMFKGQVELDNNLRVQLVPETLWERLQTGFRYQMLWKYFWQESFAIGSGLQGSIAMGSGLLFWLLLLPLFAWRRIALRRFMPLLCTVLMLAGYLSIYLLTSVNIDWHLRTSLPRLIMQLWPCLILAVYFLVPAGAFLKAVPDDGPQGGHTI